MEAQLYDKRGSYYKSGPEKLSDFKTKLIVVLRMPEFSDHILNYHKEVLPEFH